MLAKLLSQIRNLIPRRLFNVASRPYHYILAWLASIYYGHPSQNIKIVAITGTKGKTTTAELISAILEEAGYSTAISSTLRTKLGSRTIENKYKMTTPGRFFLQRFLQRAVSEECDYAIIEVTSQAISQYRHRFIDLDAIIFTGIHPEHIEAHGTFENYLNAKLALVKSLSSSYKRPRIIVANDEDPYGQLFLDHEAEIRLGFNKAQAGDYKLDKKKTEFSFQDQSITANLPGEFNLLNIMASIIFCTTQGVGVLAIKKGVEKLSGVPGRVEYIDSAEAHGLEVVIDYAHTTGSLEAIYELFRDKKMVCVLGSCGGGRDKWKRPELARIAEARCAKVILTNEDPYDEDPEAIIGDMLTGIKDTSSVIIEIDRRKAIYTAYQEAKKLGTDSVVVITGKGTDPYIMGARGSKLSWSDKLVAEEELARLKD